MTEQTRDAGYPDREDLDRTDLDVLRRQTGRSWTVLRHLTGGMTDPAYIVGQDERRAVLKIKEGDWWAAQLTRAVDVVDQLRAAGYPTPAVVGSGRLDEHRSYLLTEFCAGHSRTVFDSSTLDNVLAAVEVHGRVHPGPVRDWSAMVGAFVTGGVTDVGFHDSVAPLARRALAALPRPVPTLPTGEFVHSDFTLRNMLFHGGRLTAVVDIEGFGQGTRATDLVSLLPTAAHPEHGSPQAVARVVEQAIAAAGTDGFVVCVVHRVLAGLAWASDHPGLLPDARDRAEVLLDLVG